MKGYSERKVFTDFELSKFEAACGYVASLDEQKIAGIIRCHELARAVGRLLQLQHEDGVYAAAGSEGGVDHSWLLVPCPGGHSILDVYSVGRLPQVQLLYCGPTVPHHTSFLPRGARVDINDKMILKLMQAMLPTYGRSRFPPDGTPPPRVLMKWFPPMEHYGRIERHQQWEPQMGIPSFEKRRVLP